MIIKGVLREELDNSIKMKKKYEKELSNLPVGSLIKKKIRGHEYYYIVLRDHGNVKFIYKGKNISKDLIKKYARAKDLREKYRKSLSQLKKQIRFLKGALRGKESI